MRLISSLSAHSTLALLLVLTVGCRDSEIVAYRVPKEKSNGSDVTASPVAATPKSAVPTGDSMTNTAVATATGEGLTWRASPAWQAKLAGGMRKGSYAVVNAAGETADLSITAFPGDVGGESANVNRWRSQLQLPPLSDSEVAASLTRVATHGLKIAWVDLSNASASPRSRMLGAIVPFGGATWFFKLMGPDAVVAPEQPHFLEFLQTIQPATAPAQP